MLYRTISVTDRKLEGEVISINRQFSKSDELELSTVLMAIQQSFCAKHNLL